MLLAVVLLLQVGGLAVLGGALSVIKVKEVIRCEIYKSRPGNAQTLSFMIPSTETSKLRVGCVIHGSFSDDLLQDDFQARVTRLSPRVGHAEVQMTVVRPTTPLHTSLTGEILWRRGAEQAVLWVRNRSALGVLLDRSSGRASRRQVLPGASMPTAGNGAR